MKTKLIAFALAALLGLSACGGGDPEDDDAAFEAMQDEAPIASMAATTRTTSVVLFGDSTEAGSRLNRVTNPGMEAQRFFDAKRMPYTVRDEAVGGTALFQLLAGTDGLHNGKPYAEYVRTLPEDIVGGRFGLNENHLGQTQAQYRASLQEFVKINRAAGKYMVLSTPSPITLPRAVEFAKASARTVREVVRANRDVAVLCDQWRYAMDAGMTATLDEVHATIEMQPFQGRKLAWCIARARALKEAAQAR